MASTVLVETTGGATFLGKDSIVPVRINNRVYTTKKASELRSGDIVMYEKEYARTTLEKIEPYLLESPRYVLARHVLFEQNSQGQLLPRLRCELWRGIYKDEASKRKILMENGEDFSDDEYTSMLDTVYGAIGGDSSAPVKKATVMNWLIGETIAPDEKDVYRSLAQINPSFMDWYNSFHPDAPYMHFYDVYLRVHQGVMRSLSKRKAPSEQLSHERRMPEVSISLAPEIKAVLKYVIGEVNDQISFVRVTGVKKVEKSGSRPRELERSELRLTQGIYHKAEPPTPEIKIKDMNELRRDQCTIEALMIKCFRDYLAKALTEPVRATHHSVLGVSENLMFFSIAGAEIYERLISNDIPESCSATGDRLARRFLEDLRSGKVEETVGIAHDTLKEAGDALRSIANNMPYLLNQYVIATQRLNDALFDPAVQPNDRRVKRLQKKVKGLLKDLKMHYGWEEVMLPDLVGLEFQGPDKEVERFRSSVQEKMVTREQMTATLDDYGIEPLSKYLDGKSLTDYFMGLSHVLGVSVVSKRIF